MDDGGARDALVGGWRLVSWETRAADGQVTHPMGTDPIGYVLYTADGRFSIAISRRDRAGFATGDVLGGTTEEKARAVWRALWPTRAATASMAIASFTMWSCRCSPTGWAATSSGGWSLPGTG